MTTDPLALSQKKKKKGFLIIVSDLNDLAIQTRRDDDLGVLKGDKVITWLLVEEVPFLGQRSEGTPMLPERNREMTNPSISFYSDC